MPQPGLDDVTFRSTPSLFAEPAFEVISAAEAECATPPPGLELVTARTASNTNAYKEVSVQCPAGKHVTGTGAEIVNAFGHAVLDQIEPDPALTRVTAAARAAQIGPPGNWWLRGYAICINR